MLGNQPGDRQAAASALIRFASAVVIDAEEPSVDSDEAFVAYQEQMMAEIEDKLNGLIGHLDNTCKSRVTYSAISSADCIVRTSSPANQT